MELNDVLIQLIQQNRVLYDVNDSKYSDSQHKELVWKDISKKLNVSADSCKKRWKNIRDCYRKYWKETMRQQSCASKKIKLYKHASQLDFLLPYFRHRSDLTISSLSREDISKQNDDSNSSMLESPYDPLALISSQSDVSRKEIGLLACTEPVSSSNKPPGGDENNALKTFCDSLYYSIQKLPPTLQIETKMKIFQIMTEAELKAHAEHCQNMLPFLQDIKQIPPSPDSYSSRGSSPINA